MLGTACPHASFYLQSGNEERPKESVDFIAAVIYPEDA